MNYLKTFKRISFLSLLFTIVALFSFEGCNRCEESGSVSAENGISITFLNKKTGTSLFEHPSSFPRDSLKILNELFEPQAFRFNDYFEKNTIILSDIYNETEDQLSINQEICKTYLFQFFYTETNTIKICYQTQTTKCDETIFSYLKAYFNGNLVYEEGEGAYHQITLEL